MNDYKSKGDILIGLARTAIASELELAADTPVGLEDEWLQVPAASFVTLHLKGSLRGCIGTLDAHRPLIEDVRSNAIAAAFRDPRFEPLTAEEFDDIEIEVSILSTPEPMHARSQAIACSRLRPGVDGVVLKYGQHKATFLPQVWSQLPGAEEFLAHLKVKAGLPADFWNPEILLYKYQVVKYSEASKKSSE